MEGSVLQTNICWVGVYCFIDGKNLQTMIEGKDFRSHEKASSQKLIFDKTVVQISKKKNHINLHCKATNTPAAATCAQAATFTEKYANT